VFLNASASLYFFLQSTADDLFDVDKLAEKFAELATESGKRKSKSDKKQQRTLFRDVLKTFEVSIISDQFAGLCAPLV
jgi:hypothetical protein